MIKTFIGVTLALILVVVGVVFFQNTMQENNGAQPTPTPNPASQNLEAIAEDPDTFLGQQVTVQGEVNEIVNAYSIVLKVPDEFLGNEILVISSTMLAESDEMAETMFSDKKVRLTGTVSTFAYTEHMNIFGENTDQEFISVYEEKPYISTDSIEVIQED